MEQPSEDHRWMSLALELAAKGQGAVEPNPMVGCVLVKNGTAIGQGYHRKFGGPHAEVEALNSASTSEVEGSTAYVTLEPCSHFGKTPPCCDALIQAKVSRVVIALADPFAQVNGEGIRRLREAKIEVSMDVLREQAQELNAPYLKRIGQRRPWVIGKWAMTSDGRIATRDGESQWISGEASRRQVHQLRGRVDAILVGMGTVRADNPKLTARIQGEDQPLRVAKRIVACRSSTPSLDSHLVQTADRTPTLLYVQSTTPASDFKALRSAGVEIHCCRAHESFAFIDEMLEHLAEQGVTNLMVEAGPTLLGSLLRDSSPHCHIDELHVYVGAKIFGGVDAPGPTGGLGVGALASAANLRLQNVDRFGDDVRMIYRVISR